MKRHKWQLNTSHRRQNETGQQEEEAWTAWLRFHLDLTKGLKLGSIYYSWKENATNLRGEGKQHKPNRIPVGFGILHTRCFPYVSVDSREKDREQVSGHGITQAPLPGDVKLWGTCCKSPKHYIPKGKTKHLKPRIHDCLTFRQDEWPSSPPPTLSFRSRLYRQKCFKG